MNRLAVLMPYIFGDDDSNTDLSRYAAPIAYLQLGSLHAFCLVPLSVGFKAIAVTVDTPMLGRREADLKNRFALPPHLTLGNFDDRSHKHGVRGAQSGSSLVSYFGKLIDSALTWDEIAWLRQVTNLKVVVKGVITAEAAVASVRSGVDGEKM